MEEGRIHSREFFLDLLDNEVKRARRYNYSLWILKIKVSKISGTTNGKDIQDCFHRLIQFAEKELRESDIPGFLGEYQLAIIFSGTDPNKAAHAQARLEKRMEYYRLKEDPCDVQVDLICFPTDGSNTPDLIESLTKEN